LDCARAIVLIELVFSGESLKVANLPLAAAWLDSHENVLQEIFQFLKVTMIAWKLEIALISNAQNVHCYFQKISASDPVITISGKMTSRGDGDLHCGHRYINIDEKLADRGAGAPDTRKEK
jgi:hypothetical protein